MTGLFFSIRVFPKAAIRRRLIAAILPVLAAFPLAGADFPPELEITDNRFYIGDATFAVVRYNRQWVSNYLRPENCKPDLSPGKYGVSGVWPIDGTAVRFQAAFTATAPAAWRYRADFDSPQPLDSALLALVLELPAEARIYTVAGEKRKIPAIGKNRFLYDNGKFRELELAVGGGQILKIRGNGTLQIQDNRIWGINTVSFRFAFDPPGGELKQANLELDFALTKPGAKSVVTAELPEEIKIAGGDLVVGDANLSFQHRNRVWVFNRLALEQPQLDKSAKRYARSGIWKIEGVPVKFSELITAVGPDKWRLKSRYHSPEATKNTSLLALELAVPATQREFSVSGRKFVIPEIFDQRIAIFDGRFNELLLPVGNGLTLKIRGNESLYVQDNRKWNTNTISFRLKFDSWQGEITRAALDLDFELLRTANDPVPLTRYFNEQSIMAPRAPIRLGALEFAAATAEDRNNALRVAATPTTIDLSAGKPGKTLLLLQSVERCDPARGALGEITVEFADRSVQTVVAGFNSNSIVMPGDGNMTAQAIVLHRDNPRRITFRAINPEAEWCIFALTLATEPVGLSEPDVPYEIKAGVLWQKLDTAKTIAAGSPLDFSGWLDAPAGKYGAVTCNSDGHFVFADAPDKRIRFFGVNTCFAANFLTREQADELAEQLARHGYNSLRIHHYDEDLIAKNSADSLTFDPKQLDRLDYLFAAMKRRGIYICIDLFTIRKFRPGDNIPELKGDDTGPSMKALAPVSPAAMANWKEFARRLLLHRNPYTQMTYAEDPALYSLNLINENVLSTVWAASGVTSAIYRRRFAESPEVSRNPALLKDPQEFRRFLDELQLKTIREQSRFLREELKLKALITDLNYMTDIPLALLRNELDFVDNHQYHDHMRFGGEMWRMPFLYSQTSAIRSMGITPAYMMPSRITGKPFTVTEFNYMGPNRYRAEGGPLLGALAALQDWDGLYRFSWSHTEGQISQPWRILGFDAVNDPLAQLSDRISMALFMRGDMPPASRRFSVEVPRNFFAVKQPDAFPPDLAKLGLFARIGSHVEGSELPAGIRSITLSQATKRQLPEDIDAEKQWAEALAQNLVQTPNLMLDGKQNRLIVATPRSAAAVLEMGSLTAGDLRVSRADSFQTVAAISLDDQPLTVSRRILVLHLSDLSNSGTAYRNRAQTVMTELGQLPILVRRATAEVELSLAGTDQAMVYALYADGSKRAAVPAGQQNGKLRFCVDTCRLPGGVLAYLVER